MCDVLNYTYAYRLSGVHKMPNQELNERDAKGTGAGIIFSKRKGGIGPLKSHGAQGSVGFQKGTIGIHKVL